MGKTSKVKQVLKKTGKWVIIVLAIMLALMFILMSIGGMFVPDEYLDPWDKRYASRLRDLRLQLLSVGILAPNAHNLQHWKFELDKDEKVFKLFADPKSIIPQDPTHREMMISCGTLLEYVNIAAKKKKVGLDIELFPDGPIDEENFEKSIEKVPVAKVTINDKVDLQGIDLYDNMFLQETNRYEYIKTPLTQAEIDLYKSLNDFEDLNIKFISEKEALKNISELTLKGLSITYTVPKLGNTLKKITRVNEYQKVKKPFGFSLESQGIKNPFIMYPIQGLLTTMPFLGSNKIMNMITQKIYKKLYDSTATYMVIVCPVAKMNDRVTQVNCGRLYSRLVLTGHKLKMGFHPMSALIADYEEAVPIKGEFMTKYLSADEYPFMMTRVGLITKMFPKSMRKGVLEFIK